MLLLRATRAKSGSDAAPMGAAIGKAQSLAGMGGDLGGGLTETELDYLRREEFALAADDVLWRRSKLGLHLGAQGQQAVAAALARDYA